MVIIKTENEIDLMKESGAITASVFEVLEKKIRPGISTKDIDDLVYEHISSQGGTPSFLHYGEPPFPASACVSINEEVVHGIPAANRILKNGDIVSVDVGTFFQGFHSDACRTFLCGEVAEEVQKLVRVTEESFWKAVEKAVIGNRIGDISYAVQEHCEKHGFGVVRELSGHGIGRNLHEDPEILNYGRPGTGMRLAEGMVICIEPMITLGSPRISLLDDEWTIVTRDGKAASHYENTVAITRNGPIILTCTGKSTI